MNLWWRQCGAWLLPALLLGTQFVAFQHRLEHARPESACAENAPAEHAHHGCIVHSGEHSDRAAHTHSSPASHPPANHRHHQDDSQCLICHAVVQATHLFEQAEVVSAAIPPAEAVEATAPTLPAAKRAAPSVRGPPVV